MMKKLDLRADPTTQVKYEKKLFKPNHPKDSLVELGERMSFHNDERSFPILVLAST